MCLAGCRGAGSRLGGGPEPTPVGPGGSLLPVPDPAFRGGPSLGGPAFPSSSRDSESVGSVPNVPADRGGSAAAEPARHADTPLRARRAVGKSTPDREPSVSANVAQPALVEDDGWRAVGAPATVTPEPRLFPIGDVRVRPIR
jgi:hypothetical protein